jgi:hypothetical protein
VSGRQRKNSPIEAKKPPTLGASALGTSTLTDETRAAVIVTAHPPGSSRRGGLLRQS